MAGTLAGLVGLTEHLHDEIVTHTPDTTQGVSHILRYPRGFGISLLIYRALAIAPWEVVSLYHICGVALPVILCPIQEPGNWQTIIYDYCSVMRIFAI